MDIDAYCKGSIYEQYQNLRPDYSEAILVSIDKAEQYIKFKGGGTLCDFCCGVGNVTKNLSHRISGIKKAILIDINTNFIEEIDRSELHIDEVQFINQNILDVPLIKESDLVLSIFAYHHVCDSDKIQYIKQIENALKKGGTVILTEIFIPNKQLGLQYYRKLFDNISLEDRSSGLRRFLQQTAKSEDFEFKVSKEFADKQFEQMGFKKIEETKIRPIDDEFGRDVGTFGYNSKNVLMKIE